MFFNLVVSMLVKRSGLSRECTRKTEPIICQARRRLCGEREGENLTSPELDPEK